MKIEGPNKSTNIRSAGKTDKKKAAAGDFGGLIDDAQETASSASVSGSSMIGQLDALLSLQEAGSGTSEEARAKAKKRATMLLDMLDQVRMGILLGGIPKTHLQQLSHMVSAHRENVMDPALAEILDEIDLRAQVELAKHSRNA